MDHATRLKRLRFRAWHRGTKEADLMIGGFCNTNCDSWTEEEIVWFEALMEEQDVDIMAWAIGTQAIPAQWDTPLMQAMRSIDYVPIAK